MTDRQRRYLELITDGMYEALVPLLLEADKYEDCRAAARTIGTWWRENGHWRGEIKRTSGWSGADNAWEAIRQDIKRSRPKAPARWWSVLEWADGEKVEKGVAEFFQN